jgi:hypothetical protein
MSAGGVGQLVSLGRSSPLRFEVRMLQGQQSNGIRC